MKTNKIFISAVAISSMLLFATSCSKDFYTKVNTNNNQPTVVPPNTLLPGIEVSLAYAQGGDASRYTSVFIQQGFGAAREATAYENYEISGANLPEQLWDNMYTSDMENAYTLINLSNSNGYNMYAGIGSILMAYSLQTTVDFWGSIPYSQAFKGAANLNPAYDKDATLYGTIIGLCNTGIADLNNASPGTIIPGSDDVLYNGNAQQWIAFATAIKARIYIHQTKHNNVAMADSALNCATRALSDGFTNAVVVFPGVPNSNPNYQYIAGWGDITYVTSGLTNVILPAVVDTFSAHVALYDTMAANNDPRIPIYYNTAGASTSPTPIVGMGNYYGSPTSPVELITKEELDFIQAEATLRSGGSVAAASVFYANAINDNFTKLGIGSSATAYVLANPLAATTAGAEYNLGKQEWIALFLNPEEWSTWRRTGAPNLTPTPTAPNPVVPRRMVLPNSEIAENANAPQGETLWNPTLFWDN